MPKTKKKRSILEIVEEHLPSLESEQRPKHRFVKLKKASYPFLFDSFFSKQSSPEEPMEEALQLAKSITEPNDRDHVLQKIALGTAKQGDTAKALQIINQIQNRDNKEYVLTQMTGILAGMGEWQCGREILSTLRNPAFREDAITYLIKGYLEDKQYHEGIAFVETIKIPEEKVMAAKLILHHARSSRDRKQADRIRHRFPFLA